MPTTKHILCLANSRKPPKRCVAGKEVTAEGYGRWVRPVSNPTGGGLSLTDINYENGETPKVLDIVAMSLLNPAPYFYQSENHLNDACAYWVKVAEACHAELADIEDRVDTLWTNGYDSGYGQNDKIPEVLAKETVTSSLLLISPTTLTFKIGLEYENQRKVRAEFEYNNVQYGLRVTDILFETMCLTKDNGRYQVNPDKWYLCVSLGEAFREHCYKLVAAVIRPL